MSNSHSSALLHNIKITQQHPFHVLTSSKIPVLTATLSGIVALTLIAKLHSLTTQELGTFSSIAVMVSDPLFSLGELQHISYNLTILGLLSLLTSAM